MYKRNDYPGIDIEKALRFIFDDTPFEGRRRNDVAYARARNLRALTEALGEADPRLTVMTEDVDDNSKPHYMVYVEVPDGFTFTHETGVKAENEYDPSDMLSALDTLFYRADEYSIIGIDDPKSLRICFSIRDVWAE